MHLHAFWLFQEVIKIQQEKMIFFLKTSNLFIHQCQKSAHNVPHSSKRLVHGKISVCGTVEMAFLGYLTNLEQGKKDVKLKKKSIFLVYPYLQNNFLRRCTWAGASKRKSLSYLRDVYCDFLKVFCYINWGMNAKQSN